MPTDSTPYRHLFGPVPSRRLGRSLGIDLTPGNTCSYNCVYCQLGPTVRQTLERREWVPTDEVLGELRRWHSAPGNIADVVTLAGSGEPTLHTGFGTVLEESAHITALPTVLLTNGSLLHLEEVRRDACRADIVKVTLSALDPETWHRLHRPDPGLDLEQIKGGLLDFRSAYGGTLWLELMIVKGFNDDSAAIAPIAEMASRLHPEQVQINTVVRPPAESAARSAEAERLLEIAQQFSPPAVIIGGYAAATGHAARPAPEVLAALACRHPLTLEEAVGAFGVEPELIAGDLEQLLASGKIRKVRRAGKSYFTAPEGI